MSGRPRPQGCLGWHFWFIKECIQYSEYLQICTKNYRFHMLNSKQKYTTNSAEYYKIYHLQWLYLHYCTSNLVKQSRPLFSVQKSKHFHIFQVS